MVRNPSLLRSRPFPTNSPFPSIIPKPNRNISLTNHRQQFLESTFPSYTTKPTPSAIAAAAKNDEKELDKEESTHTLTTTSLSIPNTITKFLLDQTIGAAVNTLAFSLAMSAFKGANFAQAWQMSKQDFWPIMSAGWRLWPLVCALNYTVVRTVEMRSLVGNLAGVGWNVYLSLVAGAGT